MNREQAERCTILRGLVGSTVHGLNVNDGIEDRDEMGICVEPLEEAMALGSHSSSSSTVRPPSVRGAAMPGARPAISTSPSTALENACVLALKGNPTILLLLFTPDDQLVHCDSMQVDDHCRVTSETPAGVPRRSWRAL